jgi:hypothetical protein
MLHKRDSLQTKEHSTVCHAPAMQVQMLLNPVADSAKEVATVSDTRAMQVQMLLNPASSRLEVALNSVVDQSDQH